MFSIAKLPNATVCALEDKIDRNMMQRQKLESKNRLFFLCLWRYSQQRIILETRYILSVKYIRYGEMKAGRLKNGVNGRWILATLFAVCLIEDFRKCVQIGEHQLTLLQVAVSAALQYAASPNSSCLCA